MVSALDVLDLITDMEALLKEMDVPIEENIIVNGKKFPACITPSRIADAKAYLFFVGGEGII